MRYCRRIYVVIEEANTGSETEALGNELHGTSYRLDPCCLPGATTYCNTLYSVYHGLRMQSVRTSEDALGNS